MTRPGSTDVFEIGDAYEPYVGRWSRDVAREFLPWLNVAPGGRWLDVGCGTGVLSGVILEVASPAEIVGIDRSAGFIAYARTRVRDSRAHFEVGDASALNVPAGAFDAVVAGLVLNFVPVPATAVAEMVKAVRPDGVVGVYVWDYADGMEMMRSFWDAAVALDQSAAQMDEGRRFTSVCDPGALAALFRDAGLRNVEARAVDTPTVFQDFNDYWTPFLGGQGTAPGYVATLSEDQRSALRDRLTATLPFAADGSIPLTARSWAVRGER